MDAKPVPGNEKVFLPLVFLLSTVLCAQEQIPYQEQAPYTEERSEGSPIFQRLSWTPEEYALRYEVRIELLSPEGIYKPVLRQSTGENYLVVSLPPGIYRYSVQSYNLLDKPVEDPPWIRLSILPLPPHPGIGLPDHRYFYLSAGYEAAAPLHGQLNTLLEAKFYPLGFYARLGALPLTWTYVSAGFETAAAYSYLSSRYFHNDIDFWVRGHLANLRAHLVLQIHGRDIPFSWTIYGGGGLGLVFNFKKERPDWSAPGVNGLFPALSTGLSAQWSIHGPWYLSLGLEYLFLFSRDKTNPGYLRPHIGGGVRF
ncbi:MAG: hypothetical protein LBP60_09805 [Spirochaetaceae bacterium]|jgi:hypothetical protein|nr:hypothetical protein [Spirochaetaceae bacterium]